MRTILNVMCPESNESVSRQGSALSLSWAFCSTLDLSHLESGHAIPFSPQDFCSPCVFVYCCHNTGSCWPGSVSFSPFFPYNNSEHSKCFIPLLPIYLNTTFIPRTSQHLIDLNKSTQFYLHRRVSKPCLKGYQVPKKPFYQVAYGIPN